MDIITVTKENIEQEHICCAISNNKDCQVMSKKSWMKDRFDEGLTFKKCDVRGKCFIEYIPAENAWIPVCADGYLYIDCLWVSGQFKGKGYSTLLLNACVEDAREQGKKGLVILSSAKKKAFLADKKFLIHKGFEVCDSAKPDYELLYLPLASGAEKPFFQDWVREPHIEDQGFVLYYANQCPFTAKYVPLLEQTARAKGANFKVIRFETTAQAQKSPAPFTSFSLFYNGDFVTNEILSEAKFEKLIDGCAGLS